MRNSEKAKGQGSLPPSRQDASAGVQRGQSGVNDLTFERWTKLELIKHTKAADRLVNRERAYDVMDRNGLGGLVASTPLNIYYLSSHGGITQWMGRPFTTFAFLPRDENAPAALIMPHFNLYHLDYRPTWMPSVQPYSMPLLDEGGQLEWDENGDLCATQSPSIWPMREGSLNKRDHTLLAIFAAYEGRMSVNAIYALKKAIVEGGARRVSAAQLGSVLFLQVARRRDVAGGQPLRAMYRIAFITSRISVLRGRPRALAGGIWGSITHHSVSLRSLA